jgi:hypothetical protein
MMKRSSSLYWLAGPVQCELDGGMDGDRVWLTCDCGAGIAHLIKPTELDQPREQR